jgi:hypothetical protein
MEVVEIPMFGSHFNGEINKALGKVFEILMQTGHENSHNFCRKDIFHKSTVTNMVVSALRFEYWQFLRLCLLVSDTVHFCGERQKFQRNILPTSSTMKTGAANSSEMSVFTHKTTWCYNPENNLKHGNAVKL